MKDFNNEIMAYVLENAIEFGSQFDWNKILDENISKIFRE